MTLVQCKCPNCKMVTVVDDCRLSCYCIYCAYSIQLSAVTGEGPLEGGSPGRGVPDGLVAVKVTARTASRRNDIVLRIDGEEVLRTRGGESTIRVTPGEHEIRAVYANRESTVTDRLERGSRIAVSAGLMDVMITLSNDRTDNLVGFMSRCGIMSNPRPGPGAAGSGHPCTCL